MWMKQLALLTVTALVLLACQDISDIKFNELTDDYILIEDANVLLKPTEGMYKTQQFAGMSDETGWVNITVDRLYLPYDQAIKDLSKKNLLMKEIKRLEQKKLVLNTGMATLIEGKERKDGQFYKRFTLVMPADKNYTVVINGTYPLYMAHLDEKVTDQKLKDIILSAIYTDDQELLGKVRQNSALPSDAITVDKNNP